MMKAACTAIGDLEDRRVALPESNEPAPAQEPVRDAVFTGMRQPALQAH
ncbi:MAG: hypothetical protein AB7L90_25915 [Hyphomicrobiaceae bacterium]